MTLVVGAGINHARGVPLWRDLLRRVWHAWFREDPYALEEQLLQRARSLCSAAGLPSDFVQRLDLARHPLELPLAFEDIFDALRWSAGDEKVRRRLGLKPRARSRKEPIVSREQWVSQFFADLLRSEIYRGSTRARRPRITSGDTLSLVARAVRHSAMQKEHQRLIRQVLTFNVDDLLEREVNGPGQAEYAGPIYGASSLGPLPLRRSIAVHHLHGFVPLNPKRYPLTLEDSWLPDVPPPAESLVFTDEQYWRTVGNPTGFATRVFSNALTGSCVFIGLSMTDLNVMRWLAQDAIERTDDLRRITGGWTDPIDVEFNISESISRHYWITADSTPAPFDEEDRRRRSNDVLRNALDRRGVATIVIPSWDSPEFRTWWEDRFLS